MIPILGDAKSRSSRLLYFLYFLDFLGCITGAGIFGFIYATRPRGRTLIQKWQQNAKTKVSEINANFKVIENGKEVMLKMPIKTKLQYKIANILIRRFLVGRGHIRGH